MTHQHPLKPDDIAPPIDIRLVPAAALTALVCLIVPTLPTDWSGYVLLMLATTAITTLVLTALLRRGRRPSHVLGMIVIACWCALPAAGMTHHDQLAAVESGWHNFTQDLGSAKMSVTMLSDPVQRDGPFGSTWFVTAQVEHFGAEMTPTPHPAKIIISGDASWSDFAASDQVCFFGRITDAQSQVFVRAVTSARSCAAGSNQQDRTGRELIREALRQQSDGTLGQASQLLPGLILGDRSQQSEAMDQAMKVSGLSHLSAVSGAHTSLIASTATLILRSLRLPRPVVIAAFLGILVLFVFIVGLQPSIIRAATMGAIGAWAVYFGRGAQALPILALSVILMLAGSPELVSDVGFQLSVAATAGIILGAKPLERLIAGWLGKALPDFWTRLLSSSLAIAIAAQVACQPLLLTFVDYVSLYSVPANLLATPLLPFITIPGTLAAALIVIAPGVAQVILHAVALPTAAVGWIATTATALPHAQLPWPEGIVGIVLVVLHWGASWIVLSGLLRRERQPRPAVKILSRGHRWRRLQQRLEGAVNPRMLVQCAVVLIAVVAHGVVLWPYGSSTVSADWDIVGCDVGQGDMFLIRTGPAAAMVIDTGPDPALAKACLQAAKVAHIDALIITHLHADHVGGITGVLETLEPEQVFYSTGTDPTIHPDGTDLPESAQQITLPVVQLIEYAGDDQQHPVRIRWSVVAADHQASNENNASLVLLVEIYRHGGLVTALFTGDLEEDAAAQLLAQERIPSGIDILKLSHHGAKNGGTDIIEHTTPQIALIGVGADNNYGHPHQKILDTLGPQTTIRRTDEHGTFSVTFAPSALTLASTR